MGDEPPTVKTVGEDHGWPGERTEITVAVCPVCDAKVVRAPAGPGGAYCTDVDCSWAMDTEDLHTHGIRKTDIPRRRVSD